MSFLSKIRKARESLRNAETTLTLTDGSVVQESRSPLGEFVRITAYENDVADPRVISNRQFKACERRRRFGFIVDRSPDLQMACIAKGVYLGSQDVAHEFGILTSHGITHIINCATGVKNSFLGKIKYLTIDVLDLPCTNLEQYFAECHEFMQKCIASGGNVLVHCNAGVSRSATIVISYLIAHCNMSLPVALEHVNSIRRVNPNPGFMQQLVKYQSKLRGEE